MLFDFWIWPLQIYNGMIGKIQIFPGTRYYVSPNQIWLDHIGINIQTINENIFKKKHQLVDSKKLPDNAFIYIFALLRLTKWKKNTPLHYIKTSDKNFINFRKKTSLAPLMFSPNFDIFLCFFAFPLSSFKSPPPPMVIINDKKFTSYLQSV